LVKASFETEVAQAYAYYSSIEWIDESGNNNYDARRIGSVPAEMSPGDSLYIYSNFSGPPKPVPDFKATPWDTYSVYLSWGHPGTSWGNSGSFVAADVIGGGKLHILRNTTGDTASYTVVQSLEGNYTSYLDSGLTPGQTYYYAILVCDAYQGNPGEIFGQLCDTSVQDSGVPGTPVRVRFRVEGFDWDYVEKHNRYVYLTPEKNKKIRFPRRYKGRITRIILPEKKQIKTFGRT